jgi:ABC-type cobalamin/Fe3+-siderophores transport system ATPase subunit
MRLCHGQSLPQALYNAAVIEIAGVGLSRSGQALLSDFSWTLPDPGGYLLLGPSGSGKTLLSELLAGRLRPAQGTVRIDGAGLYGGHPRYRDPLYIARAELGAVEAQPLGDYMDAQVWRAGGSPDDLAAVKRTLYEYTGAGDSSDVTRMPHGHFLLAQLALAAALPVRLSVLDGHLTYLDARSTLLAARLVSQGLQDGTRFIVLTAAHIAGDFPGGYQRYRLSGELPARLEPLDHERELDAALRAAPVGDVSFYGDQMNTGLTIDDTPNLSVVARLSGGVRVRITGTLEGAIADVRSQGLKLTRIEFG